MSTHSESGGRRLLGAAAGIALCAFLVLAGLYLWIEHRGHVLGAAPLVLPLLLCLGMHVLMHGGHGGHGGRDGGQNER